MSDGLESLHLSESDGDTRHTIVVHHSSNGSSSDGSVSVDPRLEIDLLRKQYAKEKSKRIQTEEVTEGLLRQGKKLKSTIRDLNNEMKRIKTENEQNKKIMEHKNKILHQQIGKLKVICIFVNYYILYCILPYYHCMERTQ